MYHLLRTGDCNADCQPPVAPPGPATEVTVVGVVCRVVVVVVVPVLAGLWRTLWRQSTRADRTKSGGGGEGWRGVAWRVPPPLPVRGVAWPAWQSALL